MGHPTLVLVAAAVAVLAIAGHAHAHGHHQQPHSFPPIHQPHHLLHHQQIFNPHVGKRWCVPRPEVSDGELNNIARYICNLNPNFCRAVSPGGPCYWVDGNVKSHDTILIHATFAMNFYFQARGGHDHDCDFSGAGMITHVNPSKLLHAFN